MGVIDGKIYDSDAMISDFNGVDVKGLQRPTSVGAATARSAHLPLIQEGPFGGIENVRGETGPTVQRAGIVFDLHLCRRTIWQFNGNADVVC